MTLQEILNMDAGDVVKLERENPSEFRRAVSYMRKQAIRRITRTTKALGGTLTPAAVGFIRSSQGPGGKVPVPTIENIQSIRGMSNKKLKSEFQKLRGFLTDEQSTVKGTKKFIAKVAADLNLGEISGENLRKFLNVWSRLKLEFGDVLSSKDMKYEKVTDYIRDEVVEGDKSLDEIFERAAGKVTEMYQARERELSSDTSGYFDIDEDDE